jgi:hypothetical protein
MASVGVNARILSADGSASRTPGWWSRRRRRSRQRALVLARFDLSGFGAGFSGSVSGLGFCEQGIDAGCWKFALHRDAYRFEFLGNASSQFLVSHVTSLPEYPHLGWRRTQSGFARPDSRGPLSPREQ